MYPIWRRQERNTTLPGTVDSVLQEAASPRMVQKAVHIADPHVTKLTHSFADWLRQSENHNFEAVLLSSLSKSFPMSCRRYPSKPTVCVSRFFLVLVLFAKLPCFAFSVYKLLLHTQSHAQKMDRCTLRATNIQLPNSYCMILSNMITVLYDTVRLILQIQGHRMFTRVTRSSENCESTAIQRTMQAQWRASSAQILFCLRKRII